MLIKLYKNYAKKRLLAVKLAKLSKEEKEIMLGYVLADIKTQKFYPADGVVNGLVEDGLIFQSSYMTSFLIAPYNIDPLALELLKKNCRLYISDKEIEAYKKSKCNPESESHKRVDPFAKYPNIF